MIARVVLLFLLLCAAVYGLLWLITSTPYFKDKKRVGQILKTTTLGVVSVLVAAAFLYVLSSGEKLF